ncbi:hypothetical protein HU200_049999 [Digitaria exilis]|uniref:Uncharacterized protein n=1 Tax=Digitaria exilis TaxID=1010633 RepID=A0A835EAN2_9POAL|nr:hypothetical protein HU200_049999 [Digitaria exilis]
MSNRIHPSDAASRARPAATSDRRAVVYTVWKRSSLGFQGTDGFCVYDDAGRLAFRVDNYSRRRKLCAGELLLMDGQGTPLLALRPQSSDEAEVHLSAAAPRASSSSSGSCKHPEVPAAPSYRIEGSFSRRSCKIRRGSDGKEAAGITRKNAGVASRPVATLSDDVFSLVVRPGVDVATIMAIVVVMDRICHRPYTPMVCSSQ